MIVHIWWWFQHFTGMDNVSGRPYGFWSGFGSDIGEIAIAGALIKGIQMMILHHKERKQQNEEIIKQLKE